MNNLNKHRQEIIDRLLKKEQNEGTRYLIAKLQQRINES